MEPISRLSRVMGLIRVKGTARLQGGQQASQAAQGEAAQRHAVVEDDVRHAVVDRLHGIDLDTPQGAGQGVRAFLEVVLMAEMGSGVLTSPRFNDIVGEVQALIRDDAPTHAELLHVLQAMQQPLPPTNR